MKDLPTEDHADLMIASVPERENTSDALICRDGIEDFQSLPQDAKIGTGSVRRAAQLLHLRPDLKIHDIRGNVDTRLEKLTTEGFDGIILACAGLNRMGLSDRITHAFSEAELLPAVGQGALALEIRKSDQATDEAVKKLSHDESFWRAMAERSMLRRLFAGCLAPVGAVTRIEGGRLSLTGVVLSRDGKVRIEAQASSAPEAAVELGGEVAEKLFADGAKALLEGRPT